jgi:hypothetical protein
MTGFQIANEWLDFRDSVGLEILSPLFDMERVPGTRSYPLSIDDTPHNRRLLGFPATRSRQLGPVALLPASYFIGGLLWREGLLRYQGYDAQQRQYTYQFETDADALASVLEGVTLPQLPFGFQGTAFAPETPAYVLAPVHNPAFYDQEKNPDWGRLGSPPSATYPAGAAVVNYFAPGAATASYNPEGSPHAYTLTPFVKVGWLLREGLAFYGYTVISDWLADPEIERLVLYSIASLDREHEADPVQGWSIAQVLPDVRLAELLIALQQLFCLTYLVNPVRKELRILPLRDVVASPAAAPQVRTPLATWRDLPNPTDGYVLAFEADSNDEALQAAPWPELRLGNGKEAIKPAADTLRMDILEDPRAPGRQWLLPVAEQAGQSPRLAFEQVTNRLEHLRFLFYRGLQPDSNGDLYPLLSSGTVDYFYQDIDGATTALAWDGPQGLYQRYHKPWLDFRSAARLEEREVVLRVGEFLSLDPTRRDQVAGLNFLWERISLEAGGDGALGVATITYHQIAR